VIFYSKPFDHRFLYSIMDLSALLITAFLIKLGRKFLGICVI